MRWICIFNVLCKFILWMYLYLHLIPLCWSESWPPNSGSLLYSQKTLWIYLYWINFINIFVFVNIFIFGWLCEYICVWSHCVSWPLNSGILPYSPKASIDFVCRRGCSAQFYFSQIFQIFSSSVILILRIIF